MFTASSNAIGFQFEKIIADIFSIYGFNTTLTEQSHDGGYYILATKDGAEPGRPRETDLVQLSEAAKAALKNSRPVEAAEPIESEPVIYTPAGEIIAAPAEIEPTVSFTA